MRKETCKKCMKNFEVYDSRPPVKYCSIACKREDYKSWHAVTLKKFIHPRKESTVRGILNCIVCFQPFKRYWNKESKQPSYCSTKCFSTQVHTWNDKNRFKWSKATEEEKLQRLKINFENQVIKKDGCWDSKTPLRKGGYIQIRYIDKMIGIHKASWLIHNGKIPDGLLVLHKCDNKRCSNPEHLFLGTHKDNHQDMVNKGRQNLPIGENHKNSKLTIEKVKKIKELLNLGVTVRRISKDFNMGKSTIDAIKNGITWKHVSLD